MTWTSTSQLASRLISATFTGFGPQHSPDRFIGDITDVLSDRSHDDVSIDF